MSQTKFKLVRGGHRIGRGKAAVDLRAVTQAPGRQPVWDRCPTIDSPEFDLIAAFGPKFARCDSADETPADYLVSADGSIIEHRERPVKGVSKRDAHAAREREKRTPPPKDTKPPKGAADEQGEDGDAGLGEDVTEKYPLAVEHDLRVYKRAAWLYVYDGDEQVNEKGIKPKKMNEFIDEQFNADEEAEDDDED